MGLGRAFADWSRMKPERMTSILLCWLVCSGGATAVPCAIDDPVAGMHMIVRPAPGETIESFNTALGVSHPGFSLTWIDAIPNRPIHLGELVTPTDATDLEIDAAIEAIELGLAGVLTWGESLYLGEGPEGATGSIFVDFVGTTDRFANQYSTSLIGMSAAHSRSTGSGTVVAILDTGLDAAHPLLAGHIISGGHDFVDNDTDPSEHRNELDDDEDGLVDEGWGHGTFVASLVVLGAPDARLLPVRVLDSEGATGNWRLAAGLFFAIDRGVEVINICVASTYKSGAVEDAISEARDLGIVAVAAAGNCDRNIPHAFPAMQSHAFGVAATTIDDVRCLFSNFGPKLSISAPGGTTGFPDAIGKSELVLGAVPGGEIGVWEGSSMSTPLVSAAAALVRSQHPDWAATTETWQLTHAALTSSADSIDSLNPGFEGLLGAGRLNLATLAQLAAPAPPHGDLDADGVVGLDDLLLLISDWNLTHSSADLDGNGRVETSDLLRLISLWSNP